MERAEWLLMVDGAARGNPGEAGCGAVVFDDKGEVRSELAHYIGEATNNVAEYEALIVGLEAALSLGARHLRIQSDSELLVRQVNGIYKVRNPRLSTLHQRVTGLLRRLENYRIMHVRREQNRLADRLANRAIDQALRRKALTGRNSRTSG
jgi:ribonuclease HI